jgi:hypothetical protein
MNQRPRRQQRNFIKQASPEKKYSRWLQGVSAAENSVSMGQIVAELITSSKNNVSVPVLG